MIFGGSDFVGGVADTADARINEPMIMIVKVLMFTTTPQHLGLINNFEIAWPSSEIWTGEMKHEICERCAIVPSASLPFASLHDQSFRHLGEKLTQDHDKHTWRKEHDLSQVIKSNLIVSGPLFWTKCPPNARLFRFFSAKISSV